MIIDYDKALAVAQGELPKRVREISNNWSPDIQRYQSAAGIGRDSWCAAFLVWCFDQAGGCPWRGEAALGFVPAILQWAITEGLFAEAGKCTPKPGDLVIFESEYDNPQRGQHIGIVQSYDTRTKVVVTIEGNTGPDADTGEGDGLYLRHHDTRRGWVYGFVCWPPKPNVAKPSRLAVTVIVNGAPIQTQASNEGGRVIGHLAPLAQALGAKVDYDDKRRELRISKR